MAKKISDAPVLAESQAGADEAQAINLDGQSGTSEGGAGEVEAPTPVTPVTAELYDVNEIIRERGLPAWKGAALCRHAGWAPGKCVSAEEFEAALARLEGRPMGGGR